MNAFTTTANQERPVTDTLYIDTCPTCGVMHAFPMAIYLDAKARRGQTGRTIYCPNGHRWHYIGETAEQREARYKARIDALDIARDRERSERQHLVRRLSAAKAQQTKLRRRLDTQSGERS